jgi:dihydrofolate reductase
VGRRLAAGTLCFVMTRCERVPLTAGGATFCFVSGTPAEVLDLAREAAGGLDVRLGGGPTTISQFLQATWSTSCTWC